MKFIHTADWQIGMKAVHVGQAAETVREERLKAIERIVKISKDKKAEFILVAGDTFEDNAVSSLLVQRVADILAKADVPIFMIPGNHDPLVPGSVWEHPAWEKCKNVRILREESPVEIPGGILYPCPVKEKYSRKDPTAWIPPDKEIEGIRIGMAHGTVEGVQQEEMDYPIPRDAATRAGLDYLALGHWHSMTLYEDGDGANRMAYSGTHETTRFGERDSGNILIVEISEKGAAPRITSIHTSDLFWRTVEYEIKEPGYLPELRERIEDFDYSERILLNVKLSGLLYAGEVEEIKRIEDILASRFLFGKLDLSSLMPAPQDDSWINTLPAGIIRETGSRLKGLCDAHKPAQVSPEVAARALIELYMLASGISR
ncbi:MAG: DNA repair exonuclease [Deltaproteobacteria bacterium]|nr:MAG: DNA repair exonuclease [Deltaproteobacteria bacterium]